MKKKKAIVWGAGGFIGGHLVKKLKNDGFWVRGVDIKNHEFSKSVVDEFICGDLRDPLFVQDVLDKQFDEMYQLAADMGGAGYIFTGENDANVMHNSALINLNAAYYAHASRVRKLFFSSSACIYPQYNQEDPDDPNCAEDSAYPAAPDSEYGWEKIFSERMFAAFHRNYDITVKIARFHNVFGPEGVWDGGREKAPAALCRKIAEAKNGGTIEMWGDGKQTRTFLYIDECLQGVRKLMDHPTFHGPVNIGSDEMVSINGLAEMIMQIAGKKLTIHHIPGPLGVRGRTSDNTLIKKELQWAPSRPLRDGLEQTYAWIVKQVDKKRKNAKKRL